jgi:flavin-dependent dehydrogenase
MEFDGGTTPHLNRTYSDHWAIRRSGVTVHDNLRFFSAVDHGSHVDIVARNENEERHYRARFLIGADGPNSQVARTLYPGYRDTIIWFTVKQHLHDIIECPLDPDFFHFWVHPGLGYYTWSHLRNGRQIVGVGYEAGADLSARHAQRSHPRSGTAPGALRPPRIQREQLKLLINRYIFGRGTSW